MPIFSRLAKIYSALAISLSALCAVAAPLEVYTDSSGKPVSYGGKIEGGKIMIPKTIDYKPVDFRGVWVATVENIDFKQAKTADEFKKQYIEVVNNLKNLGANAIIFQVRPTNDAFYPSKLNPWSRYLAGAEGKGIAGLDDPLKFMVAEAHKRGLEFHAWLNPYRVTNATDLSKDASLKTLDKNNFARKNPELVMCVTKKDGKNQLILNPGEPKVQQHIVATVQELATNYPIDAIHFDDYFYPYGGSGEADKATYAKYNPKRLSLDDWRRDNVNTIIRNIKGTLNTLRQRSGRQVQFGISPFGIWANRSKEIPQGSATRGSQSYVTQYADVRLWVKNGWIDYVVPQLYWQFNHEVAAYAALADWWANVVKGTNVKLYIGLYSSQTGNWPKDMILDQIRYNGKHPQIRGVCLFSYRSLAKPQNAAQEHMVKRLKEIWKRPASTPK